MKMTQQNIEEHNKLMRLTKTELANEVMRLQEAPASVKELRDQNHQLQKEVEQLTYRAKRYEASAEAANESMRKARHYNETRNAEEIANLRGQIEALERVMRRRGDDSCGPFGRGFYRPLGEERLDKALKGVSDHAQQLSNLESRIGRVEKTSDQDKSS